MGPSGIPDKRQYKSFTNQNLTRARSCRIVLIGLGALVSVYFAKQLMTKQHAQGVVATHTRHVCALLGQHAVALPSVPVRCISGLPACAYLNGSECPAGKGSKLMLVTFLVVAYSLCSSMLLILNKVSHTFLKGHGGRPPSCCTILVITCTISNARLMSIETMRNTYLETSRERSQSSIV